MIMFLNNNVVRRERMEGMKRAAYDYRCGVQRKALRAQGQSTVATLSLPECIDVPRRMWEAGSSYTLQDEPDSKCTFSHV